RALVHTSFHASMEASGTRKARLTPGLRSGSWRRASSGSISSASTPVAWQASRNVSAKAGSSHGVVTNRPPVSSIDSAAIRRRMADPALRRSGWRASRLLLVGRLTCREAALAGLLLVSFFLLLPLTEAADVLFGLLLERVLAAALSTGEAPPGLVGMDGVALLA